MKSRVVKTMGMTAATAGLFILLVLLAGGTEKTAEQESGGSTDA